MPHTNMISTCWVRVRVRVRIRDTVRVRVRVRIRVRVTAGHAAAATSPDGYREPSPRKSISSHFRPCNCQKSELEGV